MNWYYVRDGQQDGPHTDDAIRDLVNSGLLTSSTLVWREGLENWRPISEAAPELLGVMPAGLPSTGAVAGIRCVECGGFFSPSEMITLGGSRVCARCKPVYLQKIQEGLPGGHSTAELARLLRVAKAQRGVNLCILLVFACYGLFFAGGFMASNNVSGPGSQPSVTTAGLLSLAGMLGVLVVAILQIIYVYRLASALEVAVPVLWVLGVLLLSCIGLLLLLVLSSKATKQLREAGFKVGLLGGNPRDIEQKIHRL